jgi:hypothetical protein
LDWSGIEKLGNFLAGLFREVNSHWENHKEVPMKLSSLLWNVQLLSLLVIAPAAPIESNPQAAASSLVGTWRLIAIEGTGRGSAPGDHPKAIIIYGNDGRVAYQDVYTVNRPAFAKGLDAGTVEEKAAAFDTYGAYFGTYIFDAKAGTVTHHLERALVPGQIGVNYVRFVEVQGNRAVYYVAEDGKGGLYRRKEDATRRLIWERVEPK